MDRLGGPRSAQKAGIISQVGPETRPLRIQLVTGESAGSDGGEAKVGGGWAISHHSYNRAIGAMKTNWYEVWADEGTPVPYLLVLRPAEHAFEILDPGAGNEKVFEAPSYDDARIWLLEDEYVLVGRNELDDH